MPIDYWITREKVKIPIREMRDSHLINTVRLLRRRGRHQTQYRTVTGTEATYHLMALSPGDDTMAAMDHDAWTDEFLEDGCIDLPIPKHPCYDALMREVKRRKLKIPTGEGWK